MNMGNMSVATRLGFDALVHMYVFACAGKYLFVCICVYYRVIMNMGDMCLATRVDFEAPVYVCVLVGFFGDSFTP